MNEGRRELILAAWRGYRRDVVPADAGEIQLRERKQAFFAGATSLLALLGASLSDSEEDTPADLQLMEDIVAELEAFNRGGYLCDIPTGRS